MKEPILLLGAGKSSAYLIKFLSEWCDRNDVEFIIADAFEGTEHKLNQFTNAPYQFILLDQNDVETLSRLIANSALVISMLPVAFHYRIALLCIEHKKHMLTASYVSDEMRALDKQLKDQSLTFLFECGLDPGLDHMSAFELLAGIHERNERFISFESSTGGLVDPSCEGDNPWCYKFTWNPRNVVLAGRGKTLYKEDGMVKELAYKELFRNAKPLQWKGKEALEFYPNRDSLQYQSLFGLESIDTFIRGTIRRAGYSSAWAVLVALGMTDDEIDLGLCKTHRDFLQHFLVGIPFSKEAIEHRIGYMISSEDWRRIAYLDLDSETNFSKTYATAAQYLQAILELKWNLNQHDKDWVLMQHRVVTEKQGVKKEYCSTLSVKGEDQNFTAMSKTVGLPLAMAVVLVYSNEWRKPGINIPTDPALYNILLPQLKEAGISFEEAVYK